MKSTKEHLDQLISSIELEEKEQIQRFVLDGNQNLKTLKSEGLAIHPIKITRKSFGYADYPEFSFRIPFPTDISQFKDGVAIECFCPQEEAVKGILLFSDGKKGEFRLFAPDFPDWIEDEGVGIKLTPDSRTTNLMKLAIEKIESDKRLSQLFEKIHAPVRVDNNSDTTIKLEDFIPFNSSLNQSQIHAVSGVLSNGEVLIVHGPPGTGKTTTLIEAIRQLTEKGEKVLVSAPSNAATDHLAEGLINTNVSFIRVGNNTKVKESIYPFTPEGLLKDSKLSKEIKRLKIRSEEMRKMALQYKRRFGKEERDQRKLLLQEVKAIRKEIKDLQQHHEEMLFEKASVIIGTPVGIVDSGINDIEFNTLIIDEAGQCLEPLAWCLFPYANKIVLAGDHLQLPPTVLSEKAIRLGLNVSILEHSFRKFPQVFLLDTQYRMRKSIVEFSNQHFYEGKLKTPSHLDDIDAHFYFYDTAGAGCDEEEGKNGNSLMNEGELDAIAKIITQDSLNMSKTAIISPYSGQVYAAFEIFPKEARISTIDSFQGQEMENIIISLVRSNERGEIGFLKDHRRMNVAMTRAKEKLYVIGDSSTLGSDPYFLALIEYCEKSGAYHSIWELS